MEGKRERTGLPWASRPEKGHKKVPFSLCMNVDYKNWQNMEEFRLLSVLWNVNIQWNSLIFTIMVLIVEGKPEQVAFV